MEKYFDITLVGNNIATLVAANELSKKNINFCIIHTSDFWGGHFSCIKKFDSNFDIGMTLLEFTDFNDSSNPSIELFDKTKKGDIGRYSSFLKNYLEKFVELSEIETPKVLYKDLILDDFLISNNIMEVKKLDIFNNMIAEISDSTPDELHPSKKNKSDIFLKQNFHEVSECNHGETFHKNIIDKYLTKVINKNSSSIISRFHRQVWLPLYYPESLRLLEDNIDVFAKKATLFHYPLKSRVGNITKILKKNISNKSIFFKNEQKSYFINYNDGSHQISFGDNKICSKEVFWSDNLESIRTDFSSNYKYDKASIILFFALVPKNIIKLNFSVLNIINEDNFLYRITNQSKCSNSDDDDYHSIVCEANYDYFKEINPNCSDEDIEKIFLNQLITMSFINKVDSLDNSWAMILKNTYMIPSKNNYDNYLNHKNFIHKKYPEIYFSGQSNDLFSNSLNDQILQGLNFSSKF
tara:strand:- start:1641 stop:3041 length:1401 start_codon:yes stop_codon:yes gene_type:complete